MSRRRAASVITLLPLAMLCLAALLCRDLADRFAPPFLDKTGLQLTIDRYRASRHVIAYQDWVNRQPELGRLQGATFQAMLTRILAQAAKTLKTLATAKNKSINLNAAYDDGQLNIYLMQSGPDDDPEDLLPRAHATNNATLIFGNVILIDLRLFDQLASMFYQTDDEWLRANPACPAYAHAGADDPLLVNVPATPAAERCLDARMMQHIDRMLRLQAPLWVVLHEIGHYAYGDGANFVHMTPGEVSEAERRADGFVLRVARQDSGTTLFQLTVPVGTILNASIPKQFGMRLLDLEQSAASPTICMAAGTHPPIAYRALSLESLAVDAYIAAGGFFEFSDAGDVISTDRNKYADLLKRIHLVPSNSLTCILRGWLSHDG